jgi:superfamily I DNA/RNA helicase
VGDPPQAPATEPALAVFRASTKRAEAQFVAEYVIDRLEQGAAPEDVALLFRSVANVRLYEEALLERNVRAICVGDVNLFRQPVAIDALALLWNTYDPYRHDYLLRTLAAPAFALSDASLYTLCSDSPEAQSSLFNDEESLPPSRANGRWDMKRDVRFGWNVTRGDRDADLSEVARERIARFRMLRSGWVEAMKHLSLPDLAAHIWSEGLAGLGDASSARAAHQQRTLSRLYDRIEAFAATHAPANLGDFLRDAEARAASDFEASESRRAQGMVRLMSLDAAYGETIDHVIIPGARAGAFPLWYVPDSFLYSPSLGMIAKENVGEARASRTAKFTYYMYRAKTRELYNREERRAFVYAMRRTRRTLLVTACERATKGLSAPEFLAELQASRVPGITDVSDRWRPKNSVYRSNKAELIPL